MIYSFRSRIRYHETDKNSLLTLPALLDLFQDTSTFHGEDNDLSLALMRADGVTWVLGGWQIRLYRPVHLGESVTVKTWARQFSHCLGYRCYALEDEAGELLAAAETQYMLIDLNSQSPATIPEDYVRKYTLEADAQLSVGLSRKILPVKDGVETALDPVPVTPYMIDSNNHVNNAQYVKTAVCALPEDFSFNCFRAEYKKQARLGDVFYPFVTRAENRIQIRLCDADRQPYFIGEWSFDQTR